MAFKLFSLLNLSFILLIYDGNFTGEFPGSVLSVVVVTLLDDAVVVVVVTLGSFTIRNTGSTH